MRPICVYRRRLSLMAVVTERIHGHCTDHNFIVHVGRRAGGSHRAAAALCSVCCGAFPRNRRPVSAGTQRALLYLPPLHSSLGDSRVTADDDAHVDIPVIRSNHALICPSPMPLSHTPVAHPYPSTMPLCHVLPHAPSLSRLHVLLSIPMSAIAYETSHVLIIPNVLRSAWRRCLKKV